MPEGARDETAGALAAAVAEDAGVPIPTGQNKAAMPTTNAAGTPGGDAGTRGILGEGASGEGILTDGSHYINGKLKPNSTYTAGEHDYIYKTDSNGLIEEAHADLKPKMHDGRLRHNPNTPGKLQGIMQVTCLEIGLEGLQN